MTLPFRVARPRAWLSPLAAALLLSAVAAPLTALAEAKKAATPISLDRIYADPPLQGRTTRQAELSPDGAWVSFLRPSATDSEQLELWAQPTAGGAPRKLVSADEVLGGRRQQLTEAERMALERKRITQGGITSYQWCGPDGRTLLFPLSGDLYLVRLTDQGPQAQRLTQDPEVPEQDPTCSPDGTQLVYVKSGNLWLQPLDATSTPRALTTDATGTRFWGLAEFIAAEELSRQRGYWWSPDGRRLLAFRVDEARVPVKTRAQIFADRTTMTQQRYPSAGSPNAEVTAWVLDLDANAGTTPVQLALPPEAEYLPRAGWFGDGTPWLQWMTRDQHRLVLTEYKLDGGDGDGKANANANAKTRRISNTSNPGNTGSISTIAATDTPPTIRQLPGRVITQERDDAWVEVHDDLTELPGRRLSGRPALLWSSEASGRRQLVLLDRVTGERTPLTREPEPVAYRVCSSGDMVVYAAARARGRSRELFAVDLAGRARPLAGQRERQWRDARADGDCSRLLVTRSAWGEPPSLWLQDLGSGAAPVALPGDAPDALLAQVVPTPEVMDITAADGHTPLNAFYFEPLDGRPGPHPVITLAYGGPGVSTVGWSWYRDTALIAYWQRRGYGVFTLDTRGMANRDRAFTRAHHRSFGVTEVADLFAAVRQLPQRRAGIDANRIGFFGWSYGGFLAVRAMLDANTPFAAAVGGAPPTDWTLYDTAYTERYLGLPTDASGQPTLPYTQSNLVARVDQLRHPLLVIHGTADDNVLFEHTLRLSEAFQKQSIPFEMMVYPGKAHGIVGRGARLHLYRTVDAFFARTLLTPATP
ncbi:DPP IV N-terminal domain-containing protein [Roseateles sp. SL47]|uniref:alpha/beta fold hydrolase n=1 Tax=Roseateles sp. SL47 TaxID=2995138 RepID=UPI00226E5B15|nr:alpha/beta fold hydrolase [Roseateles sp. SL47]WAC75578.1 DPP IV N-terminal domain-containing protein [Roseateles sp. SL47]